MHSHELNRNMKITQNFENMFVNIVTKGQRANIIFVNVGDLMAALGLLGTSYPSLLQKKWHLFTILALHG